MSETWRPLPTQPEYEVSDIGRVRSTDRVITLSDGRRRSLKGRILKPRLSPNGGYPVVHLNGKPRLVHRLVLLAFVGPPDEGKQCRHLDGDPTNNNLSNLRWGTPAENNADQVSHGTRAGGPWRDTPACKAGHPFTPENTYIYPETGFRACRECRREWARARYHREKG